MNSPEAPVALGVAFDDQIELTAERNFDMYATSGDGDIREARGK